MKNTSSSRYWQTLAGAALLALSWPAFAAPERTNSAPESLIILPDENEGEDISAPALKEPAPAPEPEVVIDGREVFPAPAPAKPAEKPAEHKAEKKIEETPAPPPEATPKKVEIEIQPEPTAPAADDGMLTLPAEELPKGDSRTAPTVWEDLPAEEPQTEADAAITVTPGVPTDSPISVGHIESISASTVGTLADEQGGLGIDMWKDSDPAAVAQLFPRLPAVVRSPAMRDLRRRLLLTRADVPEGSDALISDLRLRLLLEVGDAAALDQLFPLIPRNAFSDEMDRVRVESRWQRYDYDGACAFAREAVTRHDSVYWRRQIIFCQAREGQDDAAQLGIDLLREQNQLKDPMLLQIVDALAKDTPLGALSIWPVEAVPSTIAMLAEAKAEIPDVAIAKASPLAASMIARYPGASSDTHLAAAERAAADGIMDVADLRRVYEAVEGTEKEKMAPQDKPESFAGPRGRAQLYQRIWPHYDMQGTAKLIAMSRPLYNAAGFPGLAERLYVPKVAEVSLSSYNSNRLPWFADTAFAMLMATGDSANAKQWMDIAARTDSTSPFAVARPVLTYFLSGNNGRVLNVGAAGPVATPAQAVLLNRTYSLLEALGVTVPAEQWRALLIHLPPAKGYNFPDAWRGALLDASLHGRRGETVLLALLALGDQLPGGLSDSSIATLVKALHDVGLEKDARALAIEAFGAWGA